MEIKSSDYRVWVEPEGPTVRFEGVLRLPGVEAYREISELLTKVSAAAAAVTLDMRELQFLNSAGINMIYKFALSLRSQRTALVVRGSSKIGWQSKSLRTLGRFVESFEIHFD